LEVRGGLGVPCTEPCAASLVAASLGYPVMTVGALARLVRDGTLAGFSRDERRAGALDHLDSSGSGFHAVVLDMDGHRLILHNGSNSPARQESDVMHELAHVLLGHDACYMDPRAPFLLPSRDLGMERQAEWLGAALQIPASGLLNLARRGWGPDAVAAHYGASAQLAQWRWGALGIAARVARERRARR
jgi:hypothetical protein